ncbi:MAG: hypothetical protein ISEC1_P1466 [Thiomicrorhabdus sp.]|nr:MAG: hypothetical protein ISEC1_P1466 [Thiomicrorhabdus sp.]
MLLIKVPLWEKLLENIQIGTYGWQHSNWSEVFYPSDLPAEWQLDYFANAFRVVLVPMSDWLAWSESDLDEIVESIENEFSMFFAVQGDLNQTQITHLKKIVSCVGASTKGVVIWSDKAFSNTRIAGLPVTLISQNFTLPGWSWQYNGLHMSGSPLGYLAELPEDGREQAAILRDFAAFLPVKVAGAPLVVGGDSVDMAQVINLKTVSELLGL